MPTNGGPNGGTNGGYPETGTNGGGHIPPRPAQSPWARPPE